MSMKDAIFGTAAPSSHGGATYRDSIQAWLPVKNIILMRAHPFLHKLLRSRWEIALRHFHRFQIKYTNVFPVQSV